MYPLAFPVGVAGGGLSGTYPNPTINPGALSLLGAVTGFANATLINGPSPILITPDNLHPTFSADDQGVLLGRSDASQQAMRIAPLVGSETAFAGLWVGAAALAPSGANYCIAFSSAGSGSDSFGHGQQSMAAGDFAITGGAGPNVQWAPSAINPQYTQAQQANGSNPNNLVFAPQAPGAGAASTATGTPGSFVVNLAAPVSTGNEAGLVVQHSGTTVLQFGTVSVAPTRGYVWGGPNAAAPTANNFLLAVLAGVTIFNDPVQFLFSIANSTTPFYLTSTGAQFFASTGAFGGGSGVIGIANATTNPTANPVGGSVIYGDVGGAGTVVRGSSGTITTIPS